MNQSSSKLPRLKRRRKKERSPTNQARHSLTPEPWKPVVSNTLPRTVSPSHKEVAPTEAAEVAAEAEAVATEAAVEVEVDKEVTEEVAEVVVTDQLDSTLMETQSNHRTDREDQMAHLRAEEATDKTSLAEAAEEPERTVTEEVAPEPTKPLSTSKRDKTSSRKKSMPKKRPSQNQSLRWKPSVSPLTISSQERPRLRRKLLEKPKASREPRPKPSPRRRSIRAPS